MSAEPQLPPGEGLNPDAMPWGDLRDQFAMAALVAVADRWEQHRNNPEDIARHVYKVADAMLEARKR